MSTDKETEALSKQARLIERRRKKLGLSEAEMVALEAEHIHRPPPHVLRNQLINQLGQLYRTACEDSAEGRDAALYLLDVATEACYTLRHAAETGAKSVSSLAPKMTKWPVVHSVFAPAKRSLQVYLEKIELGSKAELNTEGAWSIEVVGNKWATAYWTLVDCCKRARRNCSPGGDPRAVVFGLCGKVVDEVDFKEACELPNLSRTPATLKLWGVAFWAHVNRHLPGSSLLEHPDWTGVTKYRVVRKDGWARNKIKSKLLAGLKEAASRVTTLG